MDGQEKLQELVHLPRTWPLARLTIPLEGLSKQIDQLLEGYCFQILATNRDPEAHNGRVLETATHLTWILAEYLAGTIAWLMRSILGHASKILFDKDTQLLLTPKFWILPLYREFLNSARRIRPSPSSERARGCTGLVKVICKENKEQKGKRKYHAGTPHPNDRGRPQWFGSCSLMSTLYVWFPASWAPMVAERLFSWSPPSRGFAYPQHGRPASGPPQTTPRVRCWFQWGNGGDWQHWGEVQDQTMVITRCYNCAGVQRQQSSLLAWIGWQSSLGQLCVQLRGRALEEKGSQLVSCCQAVKMRMTGWTLCYRRRTCGLPLQLGALSLRRSLNRSSAKSGAGCRPGICGWWSSYGGGCLLTECTSKPPPGSPKKNWMLCSSTGPPDATAQTHMKRKGIVGLESKKSRHGGRNARIGWHTLKNKVNPLSLTSRSCWWRYQTRKQ